MFIKSIKDCFAIIRELSTIIDSTISDDFLLLDNEMELKGLGFQH